ncbi:hypothetical protein [Labrenzia sp. DG1229]|uniref:hypothetical protein n=1 Tax=Labrenzia sp. DG1229 TaxID=681847 RepID=UPI00048F6019|nr:hypothetical protein [Labrenzia sp. DG1229]
MGRGSEFQELGIAQSQITAAKTRMQGTQGLEAQHRYMRFYLAELFFGTLFGMLLFATVAFWIIDRSVVAYAAWPLTVATIGYVATKVWRSVAMRKKRAEDLRLMASEKDKTENETEAKNA